METCSGSSPETRKRKQSDNSSENPNKRVTLQVCSMEKVFGMELLVETILNNLPPKELKKCRRVSKQWNYRATRILLGKQLLKVTHAFQHTGKETTEELISLTQTMQKSRMFPSCTFVFSHCDLSHPKVQHVLSTFGHRIHTLDMSLEKDSGLAVITQELWLHRFKNLLFLHLPNIERLTLTPNILAWRETQTSEEPQQQSVFETRSEFNSLTKLKFLRVGSALPTSVFEFIIQRGVRLEAIEFGLFYTDRLQDVLRRTRKTHLLNSTYVIFRENNLHLIDYFSQCQLNLKTLLVCFDAVDLAPLNLWPGAITQLLHACVHSLTELQTPPWFFYPPFELPILSRLSVLAISAPGFPHHVFPARTFKISRVFPQLSCMHVMYPRGIVSNTRSKDMYENGFVGADYEDTVPSVNVLYFKKEPEFVCIQKLPLLFTNLQRLTLWDLSNISRVLDVLWTLPVLNTLCFGVTIEALYAVQDRNPCNTLDAALTGISEENCATLLAAKEKLCPADFKKLRVNNSIIDAKRLRSLKIRIDDDSYEERTSAGKTILSTIARQYAFDVSPNVKVNLVLRARKEENVKHLLQGVSPALTSKTRSKEEKKSDTCYLCILTL